ncbi:hypothetical protein H6G00_19340 [Leptolyngbya sp. FACHB-541]|uniref:hypothetical protein n=1 Tax=Leptolyngbya sp. FACHB-541 TaxID=2692810 RepID=UPI0016837ABC|nr:hypothetical protein [Leptolyngbya sp. FACHB-541]MBD1998754.1 hypothetical protein [Leptolyngbya sp. FACHB-541]
MRQTKAKLLKALAVVILLQFFSGYGCTSSSNQASPLSQEQAQENANDPEVIKSRLEGRINEDSQLINPKLQEGMTRSYSDGTCTYTAEVAGTSYDITQSDSIVTPYIGTVKYDLNWYNGGERIENKVYIEANYAYQDGVWAFKQATRYTFLESESGWTPDTDPENVTWFNSLFQQ